MGDMNDITAMPGYTGEVCTKTQKTHGHKKVLVLMAGTLLTFFVSHTLSVKIGTCYYINLSHSVPLGLYHVIPPDNLETGDLVVFEAPQGARFLIHERRWLPDNWPLVKYVGAVPGDNYSITEGSFFINGTYTGPVYIRDRQGKKLPYIEGSYRVGKDTFLPVSTHIRNSFDGRYFGTVPVSAIRAKLKPLWTF